MPSKDIDISDLPPPPGQATLSSEIDISDLPPPPEKGWGESLGRAATGALPTLGMIGGGAALSPGGPLGSVAGAAGGYTAGEGLKKLANKYFFGDEIPIQSPMDQLKSIASDLGTGATGEMGGQFFGKALSKLASALPKAAEKVAIGHLRPTPSMARTLGPERLRASAREALDQGAIKPFSKAQTTSDNLEELLNVIGQKKGDIVLKSGERVDPEAIASRIEKEVIAPLQNQSSETLPIAADIQKKVNAFRDFHQPEIATEGVPVSRIEQEKMDAMRNTKYGEKTDLANQADKNYNRILKEEVENAVDDTDFNKLKKSWSNLENARDMSSRTASLTNNGRGLLGKMEDEGIKGAALIHPSFTNIALAISHFLTKGRVGSTAATGLDALGKGLKTIQAPTDSVWANAIQRYLSQGESK